MQAREIGAISHRALRIGRRCEIERDGARQQVVVQRVEIGQEAALPLRRQIDCLAAGRVGTGGIGGIEWIGEQDRRRSRPFADEAGGRDCRQEKPLARAVEHQHFVFRVDWTRQRETPAKPIRGGLAVGLDALVGG